MGIWTGKMGNGALERSLFAEEHLDEILVQALIGGLYLLGSPLLEALAGLEADLALIAQFLEEGRGLVGVLKVLQDVVV